MQFTRVPTTQEIGCLAYESASIIRETSNEILRVQSHSDKPWITPEIIDICTEKRNHANKQDRGSQNKYKRLKRLVERKYDTLCTNTSTTSVLNMEPPLKKVTATTCPKSTGAIEKEIRSSNNPAI